MAKSEVKYSAHIASYPNNLTSLGQWDSLVRSTHLRSLALARAYQHIKEHPKDVVHIYKWNPNGGGAHLGKVRRSTTTGKIIWCEYNQKDIDGVPTYYYLDSMGYCRGKVIVPFRKR